MGAGCSAMGSPFNDVQDERMGWAAAFVRPSFNDVQDERTKAPPSTTVIPAPYRHSRVSGNPGIPAGKPADSFNTTGHCLGRQLPRIYNKI